MNTPAFTDGFGFGTGRAAVVRFLLIVAAMVCGIPPAGAADDFRATGAMHVARFGHVAVRLSDSRVLVAGGTGAAGVLSGSEVYDPATGTWAVRGPMVTARTGHVAALLPDGRVLAAGGEDAAGNALASAEVFDPATGRWSETSPMSTPHREHTASADSNGTVVVVGGNNGGDAESSLASCERYNPTSGTWSQMHPLRSARRRHTAVFQDGRLIVAGGMNGADYNTTIELLQPEEGSWNVVSSSMPADRAQTNHSMTLLSDLRIVIAGGDRGGPQRLAGIIQATWLWANAPQMLTARAKHSATLLPDGRLLVAGGVSDGGALTGTAECMTTVGIWKAAGPLLTARAGHTATALPGGRVLVTGGYDDSGPLASGEVFVPAAPTWEEVANLKTARLYHTATQLPDGSVLVVGGTNGQYFTLSGSAERYNPLTDRWTAAGSAGARHSHSATLLADGRVLVAGGMVDAGLGSPATKVLTRADMYDPATGEWTSAAEMESPHASHLAVLLADGRVLVAGGVDSLNNESANATAEIYDPLTNTWEPAGTLPANLIFAAGTMLNDGTVLAIGGRDFFVGSPAVAMRFDPATGQWTSAGNMIAPHYFPVCALLSDGRALVAGGYDDESLGTAEIYNPVSGGWSPASNMKTIGFLPVAAMLTNETLFLNGDRDAPWNSTSRSEVYDPAANTWTSLSHNYLFGAIPVPLADGRVLLTGGSHHLVPATPKCLAYNPAAGDSGQAPPRIASVTFDADGRLLLTGTGFGSAPVVRWQRLGGGYSAELAASQPPSDTSFASAPLTGIPMGYGHVTVFAGGIPGESAIVAAPAPDISVALAAPLEAGETIAFDNAVPGSSGSLTFTVRNAGNVNLTDLAVTIDGPNASEFSLTQLPPAAVAPSQAATFAIAFSPAAVGPKSAVLRVASSDPDEPELTWPLVGTGSASVVALAAPAAATIDEDTVAGPLALTLSGANDPGAFTLSAVSGDPSLVSPSGIAFGGTGANRTVTVTPNPGASGSTPIMIVAEGPGFRATAFLVLTVTGIEDPPTLAEIAAPPTVREGEGGIAVAFSGVSAGAGESQPLTVTAQSSNPALVPQPVVEYTSPASGGSVYCEPAAGQSGTAEITVTVSDGFGTATRGFVVRVLPEIRSEPAFVAEGNDGTVILPFRIFTGSPQPDPVSVDYTVAGGSAQAGSDFAAASGTAVIPAGATETTVEVAVAGDTDFEGDETLTLTLSNATGGFLGTSVFPGTIVDDDPAPALQLAGGSVTEGASSTPGAVTLMWISASLSAPAPIDLTWTVTTRDGSAVAGSDYRALDGLELTFSPGQTQKWITVAVTGSTGGPAEGDEAFHLDCQPANGPAVTATCRIQPLVVSEFIPLGNGVHALRFPTGIGQSYLIEESPDLGGPWEPVSTVLAGSGSVATQVVFSDSPSAFFRVVASPLPQGTSDVGP